MNLVEQARRAYGPGNIALRSGRSAEHQVISDVTARLQAAASFAQCAAALHDNRRLWTRLAADVADGANGLPPALRARIFYLAEFTHHHSRRVLRGEAGISALVEINTAVLRGLSRRPDEGAA
ncbi:flagellar biosynthesis regulator FlaF [Limimaricola sp. G21655-S1]|uniref:flagellar biosynthesis regulator FlaF n=1 Tax=Limimaricola sp. G21655-S1 TaxID=3014768 RepID=UPI0022B061B2|nr:flagellar biosynthesis regulator FlaF [Limimaricola sp. G21655-S1]